MKDTPPADNGAYELPYLLGVYLAVNAVRDAGLLVDGPNCAMVKADLIAGNHDLFSTLLAADGDHRIISTITKPFNPPKNPENNLAALAAALAGSGRFGALLLTGMPYCALEGRDYAGLAAAVPGRTPAAAVPARSLDMDWLEGYDRTLEALAACLPEGKTRGRARNKVAVVGYMMDRNERDHHANLAELGRLLALAGLDLVSVWPSGGGMAELGRVSEASLIISLPYGRRAAKALADKFGAKLVETGLPLGLRGTTAWLAAVRKAAGLGALPAPVAAAERAAAAALAPALRGLMHRKLAFAGDPHLGAAMAAFAAELCMELPLSFYCSAPRPLPGKAREGAALFAPTAREAAAAAAALPPYRRPELAAATSFAVTGGLLPGLPFIELGFPSYGHHCLADEPFLGYKGAAALAARLLNALQNRDHFRSA